MTEIRPLNPDEIITLRLPARVLDTVLSALGEMPLRLSMPAHAAIMEQIRAHQMPPPPEPPAAPLPNGDASHVPN